MTQKKPVAKQSSSSTCVRDGKATYYSDVLRGTELFASLSSEDMLQFLNYSEELRISKNERVFSEDSLCNALYVIVDGEVIIEKGEGHSYQQLAHYAKNDVFGESGLFLPLPRGAGARTIIRSTLLQFPASSISLDEMMSSSPEFCNRIFNVLIAHVAHRIRSINGLIGESKRWVNTLKEQLIVDKLTGLYNVKSYKEELLSRVSNSESVIAVMLKPRNFKAINDGYGHEAGDAALHKLGSVFLTLIGSTGYAFRYMGSEFAFIFHGDRADMQKVDDRIQSLTDAACALDFQAFGVDPDVRLSFMSHRVCYPSEHADLPSLLDYAHNAFMEVFTRE